MEENDSFRCSVWVCEPLDLKSHRSTERCSGRRYYTEAASENVCNFRSIFLYLAVSVRSWYWNKSIFQSWLEFYHFICLTSMVLSIKWFNISVT